MALHDAVSGAIGQHPAAQVAHQRIGHLLGNNVLGHFLG